MTTIRGLSDFVYYLPFLFALYQHPEPSRTFYNSTYSGSDQYDIEWRSTFYGLLASSIWLHMFRTIYYRLYGIKYKYHVVAVLYPSLVFVFLWTNLVSSHHLSSLSFVLSSEPLYLVSLILCLHSITVVLTLSSQEPSSSWHYWSSP